MGNQKKPGSAIALELQKKKEARSSLGATDHLCPTWSLGIVDFGGPWCFKTMGWDNFSKLMEKMKNFETMTWKEIMGPDHHSIPVEKIIKEAQEQLVRIGQDDADSIFSFHVDGEKRFHGIRNGAVCRVLWWDPEHAVCPSPKKHT